MCSRELVDGRPSSWQAAWRPGSPTYHGTVLGKVADKVVAVGLRKERSRRGGEECCAAHFPGSCGVAMPRARA